MPRESEIISRIRKRAPNSDKVLVGIGDDAAVIRLGAASDLIACCDMVVEGVHFRTEWATPQLIGRKALAATLSDVAAMGGAARFAMVSIAIPGTMPDGFVDRLFEGIFDLAEACEVVVVGGDTSSSPGPLFIDTSVIGECSSGSAVTRAGAGAGDLIFITGTLGGSALGLKLLAQGCRLDDVADNALNVRESVMRRQAMMRHLAPAPQLKFGRALGEARLATAMIDVSDGLSTDLWHMLDESDCGAVIYADRIPVADYAIALAGSAGLDPLRDALNSGEEYELLFTARADDRNRIAELSTALGVAVTAIGEIVPNKGLHLNRKGELLSIEPSGYEHLI